MTSITASIESEYRRYKKGGEGVFAQLTDEQLCTPGPNGGLSVAQIVWHIGGNFASRFTDFLTTDGEKPWREREEEFAARQVSRAELLEKWNQGWSAVLGALATLDDSMLGQTVTIRQQPLLVHEALHRSLAHVAYHVGQIVYLGKAMRGSEWNYLTIPPGGTAAYNANPVNERGPGAPPAPLTRLAD